MSAVRVSFRALVQHLETVTGGAIAASPAGDPELTGLGAVTAATAGQLSYVEGEKFAGAIATTGASALILPEDPALTQAAGDRGIAWITCRDPKATFAQAVPLFYQPFRLAPGIHPTAVVDPSAVLGQDVAIGAGTVIQAGVTLGDRVCVHPNVVIYPGADIGSDTVLHANCTIHERSRLGRGCVIHSGAAIGSEGFGFVPTAQGWLKLEQTGCTVLEDGVEVGCNSTIDRPAVGETRVGAQTKIDNLVHIAHGCTLGKGCALAAQVGLAGGVTLGDGVILAGQVGIANQVKVGDRAIASAQSGLHHDVEPGQVVSGYPAIANTLWLKTAAITRRLPELYRQVKQLRKDLDRLQPPPA